MRDKKAMVSASELAQMGACERLVLFEARYGKRMSRCQQETDGELHLAEFRLKLAAEDFR